LRSFYSTLAQITAMLLGILFASLTAYAVFLHDRSTEFSDKIEQSKLEISEPLNFFSQRWNGNLPTFLPPEFEERYRSKYPDLSEADFISQAIKDLLFQPSTIKDTFADLNFYGETENNWQGRIYFWILKEAVDVILVSAPIEGTRPEGVFPWATKGPGFHEWRSNYEKTSRTLLFFSPWRGEMSEDLRAFVQNRPPQPNLNFDHTYGHSIDDLFELFSQVDTKLSAIDKQEILRGRYSFDDRLKLRLYILLLLLFVFGMVLPLSLMLSKERTFYLPKIILLVTTTVTILIVASFRDLTFPLWGTGHATLASYVSERWIVPMVKDLKGHQATLDNGEPLRIRNFRDARSSSERGNLPSDLAEELDNYVTSALGYNAQVNLFNDVVVQAIRRNELISKHALPCQGFKDEHFSVRPYDFLDDVRFNKLLKDRLGADGYNIVVEVPIVYGSRPELCIEGRASRFIPAAVKEAFGSIRTEITTDSTTQQFSKAHTAARKSNERLRNILISKQTQN